MHPVTKEMSDQFEAKFSKWFAQNKLWSKHSNLIQTTSLLEAVLGFSHVHDPAIVFPFLEMMVTDNTIRLFKHGVQQHLLLTACQVLLVLSL